MAIAKEREIALDKRENSFEVRLKLLIEREKSMKDKERGLYSYSQDKLADEARFISNSHPFGLELKKYA